MKTKLFSYVKNLLRELIAMPGESQPASVVNTPLASAPQRPEGVPAPGNGTRHNGRGIELPLQSILSNLPLELQPRVRQPDAGALTIPIRLEKILEQLSRGVVKISFGELRQAAPGVFTQEVDRDSLLVPLPLGEILSRLNPALIMRRRVQKQVEVPVEISSPFDPRSQGLIFSVGPTKPESAPAPAPRQVAPPPPSLASPFPSRWNDLCLHAAPASRGLDALRHLPVDRRPALAARTDLP